MATAPPPTLGAYAQRWLAAMVPPLVKRRTHENYGRVLTLHILPTLGALPLTAVTRTQIRALMLERLERGYALGTVRLVIATLRALLSSAVDDDLLPGNPAFGVGRSISRRLRKTRVVRALTAMQLVAFLDMAAVLDRPREPLFFCLPRTGLRLGEALGLQWDDVDRATRTLHVRRQWANGVLETPKDHQARAVDMSRALCRRLTAQHARNGASPWVFAGPCGTPWERSGVAQSMKRILEAAGLPRYFSPKDLRHTFASLLVQQGASLAYVQQQLGHAGIQVTLDTYGSHLRIRDLPAVDRLDGLHRRSAVRARPTRVDRLRAAR